MYTEQLGKLGYFHNNFVKARKEDRDQGKTLLDASIIDGVICRLNGYALIPIEEYYQLINEDVQEGLVEKINETNNRYDKNLYTPKQALNNINADGVSEYGEHLCHSENRLSPEEYANQLREGE